MRRLGQHVQPGHRGQARRKDEPDKDACAPHRKAGARACHRVCRCHWRSGGWAPWSGRQPPDCRAGRSQHCALRRDLHPAQARPCRQHVGGRSRRRHPPRHGVRRVHGHHRHNRSLPRSNSVFLADATLYGPGIQPQGRLPQRRLQDDALFPAKARSCSLPPPRRRHGRTRRRSPSHGHHNPRLCSHRRPRQRLPRLQSISVLETPHTPQRQIALPRHPLATPSRPCPHAPLQEPRCG